MDNDIMMVSIDYSFSFLYNIYIYRWRDDCACVYFADGRTGESELIFEHFILWRILAHWFGAMKSESISIISTDQNLRGK